MTADKSEVISENTKTPFEKKIEKKEARAMEFFKWRAEMLANVETNKVSPDDYYRALKSVNEHDNKKASKTNTVGIEWVNRGPDNQGGRTRTMLFVKDNPGLIFTGSVSGGLFKSVDNGNSWERVSSYFLNNSAIASLSQGADGAIYVGTGESLGNPPNGDPFTPHTIGSGIYRSKDLGETWESVSVTNPFYNETSGIVSVPASGYTGWIWSTISRLESHPNNSKILLAGTRNGLKISLNADAADPADITFTAANVVQNPTGLVSDIKILPNGTDAWAAIGGNIYKTTDIESGTWVNVTPSGSISSRTQLAVSSIDADGEYYIYASMVAGQGGCISGIYKSVDQGDTWTKIAAAGGVDPYAQPSGDGTLGCQGTYDQCLIVNPLDKDKLYIGGITFYTWSPASGGLTRADKIGSEGGEHLDPDYIHADKHGLFFDPNDPTGNTLYITSDGGIAKTVNAFDGFPDNMVFSEQNRNYTTFQCYTVGSGKYGEVISGGQDNGTQYVDYRGISPKAGKQVSGGDGVAGAEVSNFNINATFSGVYYGRLRRSMNNGVSSSNFLNDKIDVGGCGFMTCDAIPQGSSCDSYEGTGQAFVFPFMLMETHNRLNPRYDAVIEARDEVIQLPGGGEILLKDTIQPGNVLNHENFSFTKMPKFDTEGLDLEFNLENVLMPGEKDSFLVPYDSKFFVPSLCGGLFVCTNPIQDGVAPDFTSVNIPGQSAIKRMDHSADGDMVVGVTSNGRVIIMQGWDAYHPVTNVNSVSTETAINVSNRLSGVSVDRNNKDRVLVSAYGYGGTNKIFLSTNATSTNPTFTEVQGDLPVMPVYDCLIDIENEDRFIIGTEFGVYASNDAGATWTAENLGLGARMPIYSVRQEWVNTFDCYLLSASALGGGMFTSESLTPCAGNITYGRPDPTGINEELPEIEVGSVVVYPNPVADVAKVAFNISDASDVTIKIVDLTGKVVKTKNYGNLAKGEQKLEINVSDLAKSTYFTVITTSDKAYGNKLFIKK